MHPDTHPDDWNWDRDCFEDEYPMASRVRRARGFDHVARWGDAMVLRLAMDHVEFWRHCPKPRCSRARSCVDEKVECAWRKLPFLQRYFLPAAYRMKADALAAAYAREGAAQTGA